jgi:hypothetical protein
MDNELTQPLGELSPLYSLGTEFTKQRGGTGHVVTDEDTNALRLATQIMQNQDKDLSATRPQIGGAGFIPHGDPQRNENLATWHQRSHPFLKDENNNPKVLYHGTASDFSKFGKSITGEFGPGIYASDLPQEASDYAGTHSGNQNVMPIHMNLRNPFVPKHAHEFWDKFGGENDDEAMYNAMAAGHDGVIYQRPHVIYDPKTKDFINTGIQSTHYIAFSPNQIKSATGNNGQFDPSNPDITKANGGRTGYSLDGMVKPDNNTIEMPHSLKELQDWSKTHPAPKPMVRASDDPTSILYNERKLDMPNSLEELQNWARMHHASGGSIDHIAKAMHLARKHFDDGGESGGEGGNETEKMEAAANNDMQQALAIEKSQPTEQQQAGMMGRGLPETGGPIQHEVIGSQDFGRGINVGGDNFTGHDMPTGLISYTTQRENTPYEGTPMTAAQNPSDAFGMAYPSLVGVQNTPAGAAALLANLGYESTQGGKAFQPNAISGSGYGLAQWTDPARQAAFFNAMQPGTTANNPIAKMAILGTTTPGQQLGYALNEIQQNYPSVAREMATAKSIPTATENIMNRYETPATNESLDARIALANQIARGTGLGSFGQEALNQTPSGNSFAAISPSVSSAVRSALGAGRGDVGTLDSSLAKATALNTANGSGAVLSEGAANSAPAATTNNAITEDNAPKIPVLSTEDPALIAAYNAQYGLAGPKNTIADMALGQRVPNITTENPLINTVQAVSNFLTDRFTPSYNLGSEEYNKVSQNPEPIQTQHEGRGGGGQQPYIPYIPPVETASAAPATPIAAYVPQTPYIPPAPQPYASLGANFVDPRMYQNPLFSQLLATGGKVHGNNAMGNAIRMAMGYKP